MFLLIDGITLTSAFSLPFGNKLDPLGNEKLDWYRKNLCNLKLIIIDEISLVKADMLYQIHSRLCEIFQKPKNVPFANISVIAVGDLLQVRKTFLIEILWRSYHYFFIFLDQTCAGKVCV